MDRDHLDHDLTGCPGAGNRVFCTVVPPHILSNLAERHEHVRRTLEHDENHRAHRLDIVSRGLTPGEPGTDADKPHRTIYDAGHQETVPGTKVHAEPDGPSQDVSVNRAHAGLGATFELYLKVYGRKSIDGAGLPLDATVHYGQKYDNAFWDGERMVFGDGDNDLFLDFTIPVDVIGHELTHGVTQYSANLDYQGQSGALNESISDVFGSLIKQYALGQSTEEADWLIGSGLLGPNVTGKALRSMKAPGTAYDDDVLGKDPQPAKMKDYVKTSKDNGGVHLNSGIPNHAFYLYATGLGGNAWEKAGQVWYDVLTGGELAKDAQFADFAKLTVQAAQARYGAGAEHGAAVKAWTEVGVTVK
ncbi:M4 family metallopeptidase [Streptomyces natalensis]|uniref:Neutral metalloproteinase n=1 Tax=Streptomyces natalensis ATCC 27448 TaxID=1240678 RepID=A0A0D7CQA2_9ACTN|nr:M4 family metallopeptidase [Streptomyces natalensis]KIZ18388.1 peptidase M4 [Streptomyces natalensis ATCC 27448]